MAKQQTKQVKISEVKLNEANPRFITDEKFEKLVKSIREFPEMLQMRPIVVDEDNVVLGGNMRLKACKEAGVEKVPVYSFTRESAKKAIAERLAETGETVTYEELCEEFLFKDNNSYGDWDWDIINEDHDLQKIEDWGLDVVEFEDIDYSILDTDEVEEKVSVMAKGVKKAIQIEFNTNDYHEAYNLINHFRVAGEDVGGLVLEFLRGKKAQA